MIMKEEVVYYESRNREKIPCCLLLIDKTRVKDKTYMSVGVMKD